MSHFSFNPELSLVFPCLNEEMALPFCLAAARETCQKNGISYEIIVADNGSVDASVQIARTYGARVVSVPEKGYGSAVHCGILAARGRYVAFCDADGSYPVEFFTRMLASIKETNVDLLLANRLKAPIERRAMPLLNRYVGTPALSALIRWLFSCPVYDCNSGMRMLKRAEYPSLGLGHPGMAYASEMICAAALNGWRYEECVISKFKKDLRIRPPHLRRWKDGWEHLCVILSLFLRTKKGIV